MAEIESLATAEPLARHIERHHTDRLIMLSDGIFAIATTLAALEIRLPDHPASLAALLATSGQSLVAYLLSFVFTAVFWIANRELFARVARTDNVLTALSLGMLCMIAVIPAAVHIFYAPGGIDVGFRFYSLIMCVCGLLNSAMWIYASAKPGVMRSEIESAERWGRALPTVTMPVLFFACLFLEKKQTIWVMLPLAFVLVAIKRVVIPRFWATKTVDSAA
ncbi:MAG: TMEM175 family protein [Sphingomonas sp.]|uniref:TMEM175 family protein n=1 Tax=Sphingomonas sp. TaxID=28214 RepID=UPI003F7D868F